MRALLFAATLAAALVIGPGAGLAADPPAPAEKSLWQAVKEDPRAVVTLFGSLATMATAFAGFFFGTRYNHKLTVEREKNRRAHEVAQARAEKDAARRDLAAELHAEIRFVMDETQGTIAFIEGGVRADADDDESAAVPKFQMRGWEPPPMPILETHFGRLSLLPPGVATDLIAVGGLAAMVSRICAGFIANIEGEWVRMTVAGHRNMVMRHEEILRHVIDLNRPLAEIAGVAAHDWAEIEAELAVDANAPET